MSLDHDWLKGVPMELRPRYYPKPPLRFKDIDIYIPLDAIENDYDFTEERRVVAETKMWEEYKENERLAEEERQRQLAEEAERQRLEAEERLKLEEEERQLQIQLIKQKEEEDAAVAAENDDDGQLPPPTYQEAAAAAENTDDLENFPNSDRLPSSDTSSIEVLPCSSSSHQLQHQEAGAPVAPSESETATAAAVVTPPHNGYHYSDIQLPMYHQHHHHQPIQSYYNYYAPLPQQQIQATTSVPPQPQTPMQYHLASANSQTVGSSGGSILQPQPPPPVISSGGGEASGAGTGTNSPSGSEKSSSTTSQHNHQPSKKVDLSDFEADTANPFDNVELKSINDMEVLASVLKNNMNMNTSTNTNTSLPHHHHLPNNSQPSSSSATDAPTSHQHPPPYVNGVSPGYDRGPPPTYYHQPTPIFPPVSQQQQQCPYTAWNQNGYYPLPTSSASTPAVPVTTAAGSGPVHQNQNRPVSSGSHVPSPTQGMEQIPTQQQGGVGPPGGVNSFTKLHFPYLTSMAATQSRRDRDTSLSGYYRGYTPSTEDITSQNPFLSNYVSAPAPPQLSHSPMQHHQYWPAHMTATHQQQQPQNLYPMNHNTTTSAPPPPLDPQQNQSQHALR